MGSNIVKIIYLCNIVYSSTSTKFLKMTKIIDMSSLKFCFRNIHLLEFAFAISLVSLGSNQILFLPQFSTAEASRFCSRRVLKQELQSIS